MEDEHLCEFTLNFLGHAAGAAAMLAFSSTHIQHILKEA